MSVKSSSTRRTVTETVLSQQSRSFKNPDAPGFVITGGAVNNNTPTYINVPSAGTTTSFTQTTGVSGPVVTSITYVGLDGEDSAAVAVSTAGGNIKITGSNFASSDAVYINNLPATKLFVNSTVMFANVSSGTTGNITLAIFNTANIGSLSNSAVRLSGAPSWVTGTALTAYNGIAANIALSATTDSTVSYSLKAGSGSLPTGITLNSAGFLAGTPTGYTQDTVVTFTLLVTDTEGQAAQRTFNFTVFIGDTYFRQTTLLLQGDVTNTFISDSSTNNFLITRNGDTRPNRMSPYWPGGWSAFFDGTGDYLSVPTNNAFAFGTGDFTIECWVYYISGGTAGRFIVDSNNGSSFLLRYNNGTNIQFWVNSVQKIDHAMSLANLWTHLAVVRAGSSYRLYVNGVQSSTGTGSENIANTTAIGIGAIYTGASDYYSGYISNLRILKGTALYTANFTPSTTSLTTVANTSLLTLRDSILSDDSPYNFTITRNGDVRLTTFSPFNTAPHTITANTNSVYFDGTGDYLTTTLTGQTLGSGDFTIEFWMYQTSGESHIFTYGTVWGDTTGVQMIYFNGSSNYCITVGSANNNFFGSLIQNRWVHVAIVRNSNTVKVYFDGVASATTLSTSTNLTATALNIGYANSPNWAVFQGYISNFRMVSGTAVYTANFTPPTTALTAIANTRFLTAQSTTISDNSTNNFTITGNGDARPSTVNPFSETVAAISNYTWSANAYGASTYFDGTGDYLSVPSNTAFDFGTGDFTVEAWIYTTTIAAGQGLIIGRQETGGNAAAFQFRRDAAKISLVLRSTSNTGLITIETGSVLTANTWYHVAVVRSGTNITIYINGVSSGTGTSNTNPNPTAARALLIGALDDGVLSSYFNGYIADLRIIKGTALYTGPFVPPAAPLTTVANVSLLTLQSDIGSNSVQFVDQSPHNHLITRSGNASQGSFSPLNPTAWSAYFDGSGDYLSFPSGLNTAMGNGLAGGQHTIEMWVYPTSWNSTNSYYHSFYGTYKAVAANGRWLLSLQGQVNNAPARLVFDYTTSTGTNVALASTAYNVSLNTWTHIAVTIDATTNSNTTIKFFINGTVTETYTGQNLSTQTSNYTAPHIGGNYSQYTNEFVGYISNFRQSYGTLLYTANFTPSTTTLSSINKTIGLILIGPTFADAGPYNHAITRTGDTRITPFGPFSPHTVVPNGYSVYFDGNGDYISAGSNAAFAFGTSVYTVEAWVYIIGSNTDNNLFCNDTTNGFDIYFQYSTNTTRLEFRGGSNIIAFNAIPTRNTWAHVALVREGTGTNQTKLYINGSLQGTGTDATNWTVNGPMLIGGIVGAAYLHGYVSNARIIKGTALYTTTFAVPAETLTAVANTSLLTCHTTTLTDASTNAFTITQNGDARPRRLNPFGETKTAGTPYVATTYGGSVYFDGSGDTISIADDPILEPANKNFCIEFWIYPTVTSDFYMYGKGDAATAAGSTFSVTRNTTSFYIGSTSYSLSTSGLIGTNEWTHYAFCRNGINASVYLNGKQVATRSDLSNGSLNNVTQTLIIGGYTGSPVTGYMSNFRYVSSAIYTSNFVPPAAPALPTVANTSLLLNFTTSGVADSTGRNVIESVNDAKVTTNIKKYSTGSYYFDGTTDRLILASDQLNSLASGDFTVELWVYPLAVNVSQALIYRGASNYATASDIQYYVYISSAGQVVIRPYQSTTDYTTSVGAISANAWTHIAFVRNGNTFMGFVNGIKSANTQTISGSLNDNGSWPGAIMGYGILNGTPELQFNGYIDDLRITRGYARYTANFTPPTDRHVPQ